MTQKTSAVEAISAPHAPQPAGHYVQATAWGDLVFVSGQLPVRTDDMREAEASFETQVRQVLANVAAILAEAGSDFGRTLKVTAYIVGIENWPAFNAIYAEVLGDARPARAVVPVPALHHGFLIEIEAIATRQR